MQLKTNTDLLVLTIPRKCNYCGKTFAAMRTRMYCGERECNNNRAYEKIGRKKKYFANRSEIKAFITNNVLVEGKIYAAGKEKVKRFIDNLSDKNLLKCRDKLISVGQMSYFAFNAFVSRNCKEVEENMIK